MREMIAWEDRIDNGDRTDHQDSIFNVDPISFTYQIVFAASQIQRLNPSSFRSIAPRGDAFAGTSAMPVDPRSFGWHRADRTEAGKKSWKKNSDF